MVYYQSYEFNTVLEVEDMGFMVGKSSAKPSLKLHLLRLGMQPWYQWRRQLDNWGANIHIFVFTDHKNNRFQKKLIMQNTNI